MTRRSKREISRALDDLDGADAENSVDVVWRDESTGELVDTDGNPTEPDPNADTVIEFRETIVETDWRPPEEDVDA